jgi:hypothetical protein
MRRRGRTLGQVSALAITTAEDSLIFSQYQGTSLADDGSAIILLVELVAAGRPAVELKGTVMGMRCQMR